MSGKKRWSLIERAIGAKPNVQRFNFTISSEFSVTFVLKYTFNISVYNSLIIYNI